MCNPEASGLLFADCPSTAQGQAWRLDAWYYVTGHISEGISSTGSSRVPVGVGESQCVGQGLAPYCFRVTTGAGEALRHSQVPVMANLVTEVVLSTAGPPDAQLTRLSSSSCAWQQQAAASLDKRPASSSEHAGPLYGLTTSGAMAAFPGAQPAGLGPAAATSAAAWE